MIPPIEYNTFCSRFERGMKPRSKFEELRHELRMTQDQLADALGISKELVRKYESLKGFPSPRIWWTMKKNADLNNINITREMFDEWLVAEYQLENNHGS